MYLMTVYKPEAYSFFTWSWNMVGIILAKLVPKSGSGLRLRASGKWERVFRKDTDMFSYASDLCHP